MMIWPGEKIIKIGQNDLLPQSFTIFPYKTFIFPDFEKLTLNSYLTSGGRILKGNIHPCSTILSFQLGRIKFKKKHKLLFLKFFVFREDFEKIQYIPVAQVIICFFFCKSNLRNF